MTHAAPSVDLDRLQFRSLVVGVVGAVLCLLGALLDLEEFYRAYLVGYVLWWGVAVGCLALTMLYQMVGGAWGYVSRPFFESGAATMPLLALLYIPLAFGLSSLYPWTESGYFAGQPHTEHKQLWLSPTFFLGRTALYFAVWVVLAVLLTNSSVWRDDVRKSASTAGMGRLSGGGMVALVLTVTFASLDWLMTLEPHWYSTVFGTILALGNLLTGMAVVIASVALVLRRPSRPEVDAPQILNDLGNLLLAFVMLWTYLELSQFLIYWSGNLPHEIAWYIKRQHGGWQWLAMIVLLFHFVLPFVLLLSRDIKRNPVPLAAVALGLLFMHYLDLLWLIVPAFREEGLSIHWLHLVTPLAVGGLWMAVYIGQVKRRLLPVLDEVMSPDTGVQTEETQYVR